MCMIVCNRFLFLVFSLLSIFYFIAFIVFRSDISAGNSLSVPRIQLYHFVVLMFVFFFVICCLLKLMLLL